MNWYNSCFVELDRAGVVTLDNFEYPYYIVSKTVSIQLRLIALKNEMDSVPPALSCRYFIITNKLLSSVSLHLTKQIMIFNWENDN